MNKTQSKVVDKVSERIIGMEVYKRALLVWLENECRKDITKGAKKMSDVYIGRMNAYKEIIDHVEGNLRKKIIFDL